MRGHHPTLCSSRSRSRASRLLPWAFRKVLGSSHDNKDRKGFSHVRVSIPRIPM